MRIGLFSTLLIIVTSVIALDSIDAASITGEVKFKEAPPKLPVVKISKDQDYCGEIFRNETYLVDRDGGFQNVVVFIEAAPISRADPQKENILDNTGCRYSPRVMAMQKGERLKVRNNDPKLHIPHSYFDERTVFNLSLPFRGTTIDATQKIRHPGVLKVFCDTHAWMQAYIHVFDHSFFAVTDEHGMFSIDNVPPGTYTLRAWHEDAGMRSEEITVPENGDTRVHLAFTKNP
jgi:hypothetical protein